jgi:hypothetical protein
MQEQKGHKKTNICTMRMSTDHGLWKRTISQSALRISKRQSMRVHAVRIGILDKRLKGLNGYDEVMWHLIALMKRKPVLLR